jgi:hypothetical protein
MNIRHIYWLFSFYAAANFFNQNFKNVANSCLRFSQTGLHLLPGE